MAYLTWLQPDCVLYERWQNLHCRDLHEAIAVQSDSQSVNNTLQDECLTFCKSSYPG